MVVLLLLYEPAVEEAVVEEDWSSLPWGRRGTWLLELRVRRAERSTARGGHREVWEEVGEGASKRLLPG